MDVFSKEKRSEVMSKIRSKWTKPEKIIHNLLKGLKIKHKMHPDIFGKPDIIVLDSNTLVFIDGHFWHGHLKKCEKMPDSNKKFWENKIKKNIKRDKEVNKKLKLLGYRVIRISDTEVYHDLKNIKKKIFG